MIKSRTNKFTKLQPFLMYSEDEEQTKRIKWNHLSTTGEIELIQNKTKFMEITRKKKLLAEYKLPTGSIYCYEYSCHLCSICKKPWQELLEACGIATNKVGPEKKSFKTQFALRKQKSWGRKKDLFLLCDPYECVMSCHNGLVMGQFLMPPIFWARWGRISCWEWEWKPWVSSCQLCCF